MSDPGLYKQRGLCLEERAIVKTCGWTFVDSVRCGYLGSSVCQG